LWNHSNNDPEDEEEDDAIPELDVPSWNADKLIQPVVVKPLTAVVSPSPPHKKKSEKTTATTTTTTTTKAPSAAAARQLQSRRRVRSAMEQFQKHPKEQSPQQQTTPDSKVHQNSLSSLRPQISPSPVETKETSTTTRKRTVTPPTTTDTTTPTPPESNNTTVVRFKVKSKTSGTVLRFQCSPTYSDVTQNIADRLGRGSSRTTTTTTTTSTGSTSTSSIWSSASSLLSQAGGGDALALQFEDVEGDWCTMNNDADVKDAVEAAAHRKDTMVRLTVEERDTATRVWKSLSSHFGW
jgi:hypothetical protein